MSHCNDCRWWERRVSTKTWRPCALTRVKDETEVYPDSRATAYFSTDGWDATFKGAVLLTTADFGCVQHEAKETP